MKKLSHFLLILLALPLLLSSVSAEASTDDQYCDDAAIASAGDYWIINYHELSQTFTPTMNRLTSVLLAIAGGSDGVVPIKMDIYQVGGGLVLSKTVSTTSALISWVEYTFPAVSIDVTKQYRIDVSTTSNTAYWVISSAGCYSGGNVIVDTFAQADQDFGFVTYGYNYLAPSSSPSPSVAPSVSASPSVSPTPVDIVKPISLDADYDMEDEGVRLNWAASATEGIEGYNIYRSEGDTGNYINIASVEANTNIYLDEDVESGGTYYYMVKAYIGESESPSSPVADVEIPSLEGEDEPVLISQNKSFLETLFGQYLVLGVVLIIFIILGTMGLVYYLLEKRGKKKLEQEKKSSVQDTEKVTEETKVKEEVESKEEVENDEVKDEKVNEEESTVEDVKDKSE